MMVWEQQKITNFVKKCSFKLEEFDKIKFCCEWWKKRLETSSVNWMAGFYLESIKWNIRNSTEKIWDVEKHYISFSGRKFAFNL